MYWFDVPNGTYIQLFFFVYISEHLILLKILYSLFFAFCLGIMPGRLQLVSLLVVLR